MLSNNLYTTGRLFFFFKFQQSIKSIHQFDKLESEPWRKNTAKAYVDKNLIFEQFS